ncbi:unnamed protein product [Gulo gulo]|uniref:Uncharacterized protein n=1 Tax=Gulo gulo TaxID=48420 RepID=A0A9X9M452_GULGU|nr:unnamed protein product [Gulo gulo]
MRGIWALKQDRIRWELGPGSFSAAGPDQVPTYPQRFAEHLLSPGPGKGLSAGPVKPLPLPRSSQPVERDHQGPRSLRSGSYRSQQDTQ